MSILRVENLRTHFTTPSGIARAVDGVSFDLNHGETLAVVGESGCGKTVLATSIMRLFRRGHVSHPTGSIFYNGVDLLPLSPVEMQTIRGRHIAMIFQEPMAALNPVWTIRDQIAEPLMLHLMQSRPTAWKRALELLEALGVPSPDRIMTSYPHTLSGGMRQRVAIAMALACKPDILIADEPTTALDVTVQAQILRLLKDMQNELGMAILMITHDLGVVNEVADRTMVMYSGQVIEYGATHQVLFDPKHPYTEKLLAAVPSLEGVTGRLDSIAGQVRPATAFVEGCRFAERCPHAADVCQSVTPPQLLSRDDREVACYLYDLKAHVVRRDQDAKALVSEGRKPVSDAAPVVLSTKNLRTWFPVHGGILRRTIGHVKAVDDISLDLREGETLALVGESGCGKSTFGQTLLRLVPASGGSVFLEAAIGRKDMISADRQTLRTLRSDIQIIFQDPFASLNPRFSVREIIDEGLKIHRPSLAEDERDQQIGDVLEEVGLPREVRFRYPHEFSGGQRQRVAIARAMVLKPKVLILDEATSALDVSIQAQVLNLLRDLQKRYGMSMIFITHNLGIVRYIADRIAVMYLGKIVEYGATEQVMKHPAHPYTHRLIGSVPRLQPGAKLPEPLLGDVPSPVAPPPGCVFHPRCPKYRAASGGGEFVKCRTDAPTGTVRCHFPMS